MRMLTDVIRISLSSLYSLMRPAAFLFIILIASSSLLFCWKLDLSIEVLCVKRRKVLLGVYVDRRLLFQFLSVHFYNLFYCAIKIRLFVSSRGEV